MIPPQGQRVATYRIGANLLSGKGPYQVRARLKAAMVPVNLISEIQFVGFDYGMSPREVADAVVAGHQVLHEKTTSVTTGK